MRPVISSQESRRLDEESVEPIEVLMERAGLAVAGEAVAMGVGYGDSVVVLAGKGNNGGDGYVAAKYLARRGASVEVHTLGFPKGVDSPARRAAAAATRGGVRCVRLSIPVPADLVIDAVFGVGFRGSLPEAVIPWTEHPAPLLAVDIPSGLDADTGIPAPQCFTVKRTVTFQAMKAGHVLGAGPDKCGAITVADIGLGEVRPTYRIADDSDAPLPVRPRTAHKWSVGSVLVVGGSPGLTGAAMLTATAALNSGAGAAAIACPADSSVVYAALSPQILSHGIGTGERFAAGDAKTVAALSGRYDSLILGPGLGSVDPAFVTGLLDSWEGAVVIDADGINVLDGTDALSRRTAPLIITPHAGEFTRLTGVEAGPGPAGDLADATGAVVLLKGNPTFVFGEEEWIVDAGGPELATIGTGDVLAGMIGAFVGSGMAPEVAARSAAYHHGATAHRIASRRTVTAGRLAHEVASLR